MNLMDIFRKKKNNTAPQSADLADDFENTFINPLPPQQTATPKVLPGSIEEFQSRDYFRMGLTDGYNNPSVDTQTFSVNALKADFRFRLDRKIDSLSQDIFSLQIQLIGLQGMGSRIERQVERKISFFTEMINNLEAEKALSAIDEGWIMNALSRYNNGFQQGCQQFVREKKVASATGLFNE
jgi:hypothetical protein